MRHKTRHLRLQRGHIIAHKFHQIDAHHRALACHFREKLSHLLPHDVGFGQAQHFGIDGFYRQRLHGHQSRSVPQSLLKMGIADVDQHPLSRNGQHIQRGLSHQAQRAFSAAQHAVEIELPLLQHMRQIVACQTAIELGKGGLYRVLVLVHQLIQRMKALLQVGRQGCDVFAPSLFRQGLRLQNLAAPQHGFQRQHMVARFAISATALATGVGIDHAADGGAIGSGQLGRKKQTVWLQCPIQLVFHHACLHPHLALGHIDAQNVIHVPRHIHHDALSQRLAIGACAAAACRHHHAAKALFRQQARQHLQIGHMFGTHNGLRWALVNGIVSGIHRALRCAGVYLACKPLLLQRIQKGLRGHLWHHMNRYHRAARLHRDIGRTLRQYRTQTL